MQVETTYENDLTAGYTESEIGWYVLCMLRQLLLDEMIAANFFFDRQDQCLRFVGYRCTRIVSNGADAYQEYVPSVARIAIPVLQWLRKAARVTQVGGSGELYYRFEKRGDRAMCFLNCAYEMPIYFTEERPRMRVKGTLREEPEV